MQCVCVCVFFALVVALLLRAICCFELALTEKNGDHAVCADRWSDDDNQCIGSFS